MPTKAPSKGFICEKNFDPNGTLKHILVTKRREGKSYNELFTKYKVCILMDDEVYVKINYGQLPEQKF